MKTKTSNTNINDTSSIFDKILPKQEVLEITSVIPTNILPIDVALGNGGFPRGRISAIVGQYSTCKSSIACRLACSNQLAEGITVIFDTETTYENVRLKQLYVNPEKNIYIVQKDNNNEPLTMEYIENITFELLKGCTPKDNLLIIWDTISSTALKEEIVGEISPEKLIGRHSKILSRIFRKISSILADKNATMLLIVQPKVDPLTGTQTYLGEKPVRFHSSIIVDLSRYSKDEKKMIINFKVAKNKTATPFKQGKYMYYFIDGFDYISSLPLFVGKSNSHYTFQDISTLRTESKKLLLLKKEDIEKKITEMLERKIPYKIYFNDINSNINVVKEIEDNNEITKDEIIDDNEEEEGEIRNDKITIK